MEATSFVDIFNIAATSMKEAVDKYGEQTVDLGLMVYRMAGFQTVVLGLVGLVLLITLVVLPFKYLPKIHGWVCLGKRGEERGIVYIPLGFSWVILLITAISLIVRNLFDVYAWAAVFGYPEVLIAAKALASAGLLN